MVFQEIFDTIESTDPIGIYPNFKVRVIAVGHLTPSDPMFASVLDATGGLVERLFNGQSLGRTAPHPTFLFPERWMSTVQVREFMQRLHECVDSQAGRMRIVDIVTGSPVILTDLTADMIKVLQPVKEEVSAS